jgi:exosortase/archaeosortase family protein
MNNLPKKKKEFRHIVFKLLSFIFLFLVVTGITGPWVVLSRLLYPFYFFIYGNLGKMVLFSVFIFYLLIRNKLHKIPAIQPYNHVTIMYISLSFLLIPVFFYFAKILVLQPSFFSNLPLSLFTHLLLLLVVFLPLPGVFGWKFLVDFTKQFKNEIGICIIVSLVYSVLIWQVWSLWPYLSTFVLDIEYYLFKLSFPIVIVTPPNILTVQTFSVAVAQACSGLDSQFLFSSLYIMIAILDWKTFNKKKLIFMFFPVSLGLLLVNILRVYMLIWIGVVVSPKLALELFHTYAGMVLFIIYFILFLKFFYRWMQVKN